MNSLHHQYGVIDQSLSTPNWRMGYAHQFGARSGVASANNIERLREERGWKRPELARRMVTSPQQVERLEKDQRKLTRDWIDRAANAFGVKPTDIIDDLPPLRDEEDGSADAPREVIPTKALDSGDAAAITSLDLSLSMGPGTLIEDFIEAEPVLLDLALLQSITRTPSDRLRLVKGIGDSMEPTLRTGDRILVDINDRQLARINGIYWIDHYGAHGIKRLRMAAEGRVMIISDNKDVPDFEVDLRELRIEGRVIWFGREL